MNFSLIAWVVSIVRFTWTGPGTVRPSGISNDSSCCFAFGSARATMNAASRFCESPFETGTNGRKIRNSSVLCPGSRLNTYSGSTRFPDDDAFCGPAATPVAVNAELLPAVVGSAETSQKPAPEKNAVGLWTWYLRYTSV